MIVDSVFHRAHFPGVDLIERKPVSDVIVFPVSGVIGGINFAVFDLGDDDTVIHSTVIFKVDTDDVPHFHFGAGRLIDGLAGQFHVPVEAVGNGPGHGWLFAVIVPVISPIPTAALSVP